LPAIGTGEEGEKGGRCQGSGNEKMGAFWPDRRITLYICIPHPCEEKYVDPSYRMAQI
jgi:hypothetical protein